ncbi:MAG TPA: DUF72 domain-containing protein [Hyphomicrobiales bacterium]|nr:DUF72 domain-containing protein [Hyphomicrobiales bacterium]
MPNDYRIGCSGFFYTDWKGAFYPAELPQREWLRYYAESFDTVEINNSFYGMPSDAMVRGWYGKTPRDFRFTLKGSRYLTHLKRLREPHEPVTRFYAMADGLKEKLACVLWQLPRNLALDLDRLQTFCAELQPRYRNVIEFRHRSWWESQAVRDILRHHEVAFCSISAPAGLPDELVETADFAYLRFHGVTQWYRYHYSEDELRQWARRIRSLQAAEVFIYFNNDYDVHAVNNGRTLRQLLEKHRR